MRASLRIFFRFDRLVVVGDGPVVFNPVQKQLRTVVPGSAECRVDADRQAVVGDRRRCRAGRGLPLCQEFVFAFRGKQAEPLASLTGSLEFDLGQDPIIRICSLLSAAGLGRLGQWNYLSKTQTNDPVSRWSATTVAACRSN